MRDVQRYPVLSHAEQHVLAVDYVQTGNTQSAAKLVTSNLRLVVKLVRPYTRVIKVNILDMIQEGNLGLMHAVKKYDPYKGVKLTTYAALWIRAYVIRFNMVNHRMVQIGRSKANRKIYFNLDKERKRLTSLGIEPTSASIARGLNVKVEEVEAMRVVLDMEESSLDFNLIGSYGGLTPLVETLPSDCSLPEDQVASKEVGIIVTEKVTEFCSTLTPRELHIFQERFLSVSPATLAALGVQFGVSRERIRQIETKIKERLEVEFLDFRNEFFPK